MTTMNPLISRLEKLLLGYLVQVLRSILNLVTLKNTGALEFIITNSHISLI